LAYILISFLIGKRLGGFLTLLREAEFLLLVNPPLLAEFVDVAARPRFRKHFPVEFAHQLAMTLTETGELVEVEASSPTPLSRDPKDDYLLLMAKKGKADVLITGDVDLLSMERYGATRIMSARAFTDEYLKGTASTTSQPQRLTRHPIRRTVDDQGHHIGEGATGPVRPRGIHTVKNLKAANADESATWLRKLQETAMRRTAPQEYMEMGMRSKAKSRRSGRSRGTRPTDVRAGFEVGGAVQEEYVMSHFEHSRSVGVPPRKASGSRFPLQVLCWITSLWAFRYNRSRGTHNSNRS
jgi:putative PIN family toxin of toxin-antitoxin system